MKTKVTLLIGFLVALVVLTGCTESPTGGAVKDYQLTTITASTEMKVIDDSGKGCLTDCEADVKVKNLEKQPVLVKVTAECYTVKERKTYSSEEYWMQPESDHTFKIKPKVGLIEDWKCENFRKTASKIYGCQAR